MRVAFVHNRDARNVRNWSGTLFFSKRAIEQHVGEVVDLSPAPVSLLPYRVARQVIRRTTGRWYSYDHDLRLAAKYGRYFTRRVREEQPDLIFAPAASACIGLLETDVPIVYYSDATFRVMRDYNAGLTNVIERTAIGGEVLEQRAIERSALSLFSCDWARDSAVNDYGADPSRAVTVYIGANLPSPPARESVLPRRLGSRVRLLMVAVAWESKGGPIAYRTLLQLLERGYDAELTVVGCSPSRGESHPRMRVIPFLDKSRPDERARFESIWREADFFILPTRFDATPVVLCEASANAVPVLVARTGGTGSLVIDGHNGLTVPHDADACAYADGIEELVRDPERYERLCHSARDEFEQRLNWDSWGRRVAALVEAELPEFRGRTKWGMRQTSTVSRA